MKTEEKLLIERNGGQLIPIALIIKQEEEWLAGESHPPDLQNKEHAVAMEPLHSIKTEEDLNTGAEFHVQRFTPELDNSNDCTTTEMTPHQEFLDDKRCSKSGSFSSKNNQHDPGLGDDQRACGRVHPKQTYKCKLCLQSFKEQRYLKHHIITHAKDRKQNFACHSCESAIYNKADLVRNHIGEVHNCQLCGLRSDSEIQNNPPVQTERDREDCTNAVSFAQASEQDVPVNTEEQKARVSIAQHLDETAKFTSDTETSDFPSVHTKTEFISDEEFFDEENGSVETSYTQENQQGASVNACEQEARTGIAENDSESCELRQKSFPEQLIKTQMSEPHCEGIYKCELCNGSWKTKKCLKKHIARTHRERKHNCNLCPCSFKNTTHLKNHQLTHAQDRKRNFACHLCESAFYKKSNLATHMRLHTDDTLNCEVCGARFRQKSNLNSHLLRKHFRKTNQNSSDPQKPTDSVLEEFGEFLDDKSDSDAASYAHGDQQGPTNTSDEQQMDRVTCELCNNIYPKELIKMHRRLAHSEGTHECEFCQRSFKEKSYLKRHLHTHAKDRKRKFACHLCESTSYTKSDLATHMKLHTGDTVNCELCGARFAQKSNLNAHMRRKHSRKTQPATPGPLMSTTPCVPLKTELMLDEEFLDTQTDSVAASYAHEDEQGSMNISDEQQARVSSAEMDSVACELCNNVYSKELIKTHMRRAHCGGAYKCEYCLRSFKEKRYLKRHLLTHSKDRKRHFACHLCKGAFYTNGDLSKHMKLHNSDTFDCKICGTCFAQKTNLNAHMRRQHLGETQQLTPIPLTTKEQSVALKTELMSDEEFLEDKNYSAAHGDQQGATNTSDEQQGRVSSAGVTCEVCNNIYSKELIKTHLRQAHCEGKYKCKFCSRSFKLMGNLKLHITTHARDRKGEFSCHLCERVFYNKGNLVRHMTIHNGNA